ncbi:hypothetical protein GYH30_009078 [Glycine max]|nr:hypothetical protein GYH30_009078 [Glycine max]
MTRPLHLPESQRDIGLKGLNGQLEFYNVDELETMAMAEHFMATSVEWDPTGRPPSPLSPEKEEEMSKNLKKYSKKYEAEDQDVSMLLREQDRNKRRMLKKNGRDCMNKRS